MNPPLSLTCPCSPNLFSLFTVLCFSLFHLTFRFPTCQQHALFIGRNPVGTTIRKDFSNSPTSESIVRKGQERTDPKNLKHLEWRNSVFRISPYTTDSDSLYRHDDKGYPSSQVPRRRQRRKYTSLIYNHTWPPVNISAAYFRSDNNSETGIGNVQLAPSAMG